MTWQPMTLAAAYKSIQAGCGLWIAFGTFLDDWRYASTNDPVILTSMTEEPIIPDAKPLREAAFFQAVGEHLTAQHQITDYPSWLVDPRWVLEDPWFLYPGYRLRAWQLVTTPAAFKARNIFGGDRIFNRA